MDDPVWLDEGFSVELPVGNDEEVAVGLQPTKQIERQHSSPTMVGFFIALFLTLFLKNQDRLTNR